MAFIIRRLEPLQHVQIRGNSNQDFTAAFLKRILGGTQVSNGWWECSGKQNPQRYFSDLQCYMLVKRDCEPLLPRRPLEHGAQISAFMQYRPNAENSSTPLFIRHGQTREYKYYGQYREPYYSDSISRDEMAVMPADVKQYWARWLADNPMA